jgi:Transposase DDE domain
MADKAREHDWSLIEEQLPAGWRELGAEMGILKKRPPHMGQKILDIGVALRLVLHYVAHRGSQRATIAAAAAAGIVAISQVAFFKWMAKIGPYLEALLARMVVAGRYASEAWGGYVLIAGDATTVQRPGATGTTARIHYGLHLADLRPRFIRVTDVTVGETTRNFDPEPGELWILDRGYSNPPSVEFVVDRGADILVRYSRQSMPLVDVHGERIDVPSLLMATTERGVARERKVYVRPANGRMLAARLCWMRLTEQDAKTARAHAERDGVEDDDALDAAEYIVVLTTADKTRLDTGQVLALYRARWQVELDFKRKKSIEDLDTLPSFLPQTIHAWLCAKLLLGQIALRLASQPVDIPPCGLAPLILPSAPLGSDAARPRARRRAVVRDAVRVEHHVLRASTRSVA